MKTRTKLGIEVLFDEKLNLISGKRIALVVNPASIDSHFIHTVDKFSRQKTDSLTPKKKLNNTRLKIKQNIIDKKWQSLTHKKILNFRLSNIRQKGAKYQLTALFGPQHGIRGETQDNMIEWEGYTEPNLKIPVYSLYSKTRIPTKEMLENVDTIIIDLPDAGTRVYTFIWTMLYILESAKKYGKEVIICDRPNPIGGTEIEGNILDSAFTSFVGRYSMPMRHGMTIGELALLFNEQMKINSDLKVIRMKGWKREYWFDQTGLPWIMPSPNMPTLDTATVYPGSVIFEGTNVSEGRGTTRPFEIIGAPFICPDILCEKLNKYLKRPQKTQYNIFLPINHRSIIHNRNYFIDGVFFRPIYFQPTFHKWSNKLCGGIQIHVLDRTKFKPYFTAVLILKEIYNLYAEKSTTVKIPKRASKATTSQLTVKPSKNQSQTTYNELQNLPRNSQNSNSFQWKQPPYEYEFERLPIDLITGTDMIRKMIENNTPLKKFIEIFEDDEEKFRKERKDYLIYK